MKDADFALICKVLGDDNRLKIVKILYNGEKCACNLLEEFSITQPTLSHHMKILCECGLVDSRREGKWSKYSLNAKVLEDFKEFANKFTDVKEEGGLCK